MEETDGWSLGEQEERVVMNEVVEESQDEKVQEEEHTCITSFGFRLEERVEGTEAETRCRV